MMESQKKEEKKEDEGSYVDSSDHGTDGDSMSAPSSVKSKDDFTLSSKGSYGKLNPTKVDEKEVDLKVKDPNEKFRKRTKKLPKGIGCRVCCNLRICICCMLFGLTITIVGAFVVAFSISFDATVNTMMRQIRDEDFDKVYNSINEQFQTCEKSVMMFNSGYEDEAFDANDDQSLGIFMHTMLKNLDSSIGSMYAGFPNSRFIFSQRNGELAGRLCTNSGYAVFNGSYINGFCLNENNTAEQDILIPSAYDCTERPWYQNAISLQDVSKVAWTVIYISFDDSTESEDEEVITFYTIHLLIEDDVGDPVLVFAIDMTGDSISETVKSLDVGEGGRLAIIEDDGTLVSVNIEEQPLYDNESEERIKAVDSIDTVIRAMGREVVANPSDRKFRKRVGPKNTFMEIRSFNSPSNDRNWRLVMALDRSDFDEAATITIIVVSVVSSLFVCQVICIMNCLSCCLFRRFQVISKKMKRISDLKFHKVKVSRLNMFSEIASIELSFYRMAKMMLEYRAFLPDYLKTPEEMTKDQKKGQKNFLLQIAEDDDDEGGSSRSSRNPEESSHGSEHYHTGSGTKLDEYEIKDPRTNTNESLSSCASETLSVSSADIFMHRRETKKMSKLSKMSVNQEQRPLTLVIIYLKPSVMCTGNLTNLFVQIMSQMEVLANRFRGTIISFTESEVTVGFNCAAKQTLWKGHLIRGVEFAVDCKNSLLGISSLMFRIGICTGVGSIHTFGSQNNKVRKVVGNVEVIARNLSRIGGEDEWNVIHCDFREANALPKLVVCKPKDIVILQNLPVAVGEFEAESGSSEEKKKIGTCMFLCEIEGIIQKEKNSEWMYVRENEEKLKTMNLPMDTLRDILRGREVNQEVLNRVSEYHPFLNKLATEITKFDSLSMFIEDRKKKVMESWDERNAQLLDFYYIL